MMLNAVVGGAPGKDCGGFCKFCYFKSVDYKNLDSLKIGCQYCPPDQVGCSHCREVINDIQTGFRPLPKVLGDIENLLRWQTLLGNLNYKDLKVVTASWADIIFYPELNELLTTLKDWGLHTHLGYTSGKGIKDGNLAGGLISLGVEEVNFSVVSMNPQIRSKWMGDKSPEESFKALKIFCEGIDVNASTVVIPGVINEDDIFKTCSILEDWGVKTFLMTRFANFKSEGLIYNDQAVLEGVTTQPYEQFQKLVEKVSREFSFRVLGAPFFDPEKNAPYILSQENNWKYLDRLPEVTREATIITSQLSYKPLHKIFSKIAADKVNVVKVDKEIGDLITHDDLESVDLSMIKKKVIIPGGALVHDKQASDILNKDGNRRTVVRGPLWLFYYDFELLDDKNVLEYELGCFKKLIDKINH